VDGFFVLILVGNLPKRGLLAVARPVTFAGFAHGIPSGFVLPVVITAAQDQPLLGPDDLRPDGEASDFKTFGDRGCMQRAMLDIGDVAGEERPRLAPVGAIIVQHLARALGLGRACLVAPARIILHTVGWIGHHQQRFDRAEQSLNIRGNRTVAAE